jgi:ethanolamine utilization protein EutN
VKLGRIVGTVVASRKDPGLEGVTLFVVRDLGVDGKLAAGFVVAVDAVGAGVGETVLVAAGSSARQTELTQGKPVDAVVMAIVDTVDVDGKRTYDKTVTG